MAKQCYYEALGIERGAGDGEIKTAFRRLAKECHPDRHATATPPPKTVSRSINEAYEILKDPQRRAAYDRFGHAAFDGRGFWRWPRCPRVRLGLLRLHVRHVRRSLRRVHGRSVARGSARDASGAPTSATTWKSRWRRPMRASNAQIRVPTSVTCEQCSGSGAKAGTAPVTCRTCGGAGKVRASQGFFTIERPCPACQGRGEIIEDPCADCDGAGRVTRERTLSVTIPVGVEDGTRIRLAGEGEAGLRGGPPGDLYIFLSIKPHEFFQRDGADLFCRVPISMTTAALGGQIEVPTIDGGRSRVKIPEGSESGRQFRLKGKGMPVLRSKQQGDLYIQVEVETPKNLTRKQRDLLREFEEESNAQTSPSSAGFFARVKEFFDGIGE